MSQTKQRTEPVRVLTGERLRAAALRPDWTGFPVSPEAYLDAFSAKFRSKYGYSLNQSFKVGAKLDKLTNSAAEMVRDGRFADALAALRAQLTVALQIIAKSDDSCAALGESFEVTFQLYLSLDLKKCGIEETVFLSDLMELLIWENYGVSDHCLPAYFKSLTRLQRNFCMDYLQLRADELLALDCDDQHQDALALVSQIDS